MQVRFVCIHVAYDRPGRHEAFARCWVDVGGGPALNRHWACFSCLLGDQMTKKYRF